MIECKKIMAFLKKIGTINKRIVFLYGIIRYKIKKPKATTNKVIGGAYYVQIGNDEQRGY